MTELAAVIHALRPELHRFCARLMGSVVDGEDVVQDVLARAVAAPPPPDALRPWLFRVAHNRALDLLRSRAVRNAMPLDDVHEPPDPAPDTLEAMMQRKAVQTAVSRFTELPSPVFG